MDKSVEDQLEEVNARMGAMAIVMELLALKIGCDYQDLLKRAQRRAEARGRVEEMLEREKAKVDG